MEQRKYSITLSDFDIETLERARAATVKLAEFTKLNIDAINRGSHPDFLEVSKEYRALRAESERLLADFGFMCSVGIDD